MIKKLIFLLLFVSADVFGVTENSGLRIIKSYQKNYIPLVHNGKSIPIMIDSLDASVVSIAAKAFATDVELITGTKPALGSEMSNNEYVIIAGTFGSSKLIEKLAPQLKKAGSSTVVGKWESCIITTIDHPMNGVKKALVVAGSDRRGTAYGLFELSRMVGVSPWIWWADAKPQQSKTLCIAPGTLTLGEPSVKLRGIFINDEDWGLTPWSYKNYEPSDVKGQIGPKTHARIFELLLRLRANTFWPAMHACSQAFYLTPGNKEIADKYGIFVGTSHCEPMMCNANAEWKVRGSGEYNYLTNRDNILKFWEQRTNELSKSDNIYTLGIRGIHDGKMEGANTVKEQKDALTQILKDQRDMIKRIVNPDLSKVAQVFIPYKEVLDVYKAGLQVPDDVTLMWCDDNYGYQTHFPDSVERLRKGGNAVYYHLSYWGRPHDYLWLGTTPPSLIQYQLKMAYDKGAKNTWIINVGDIKPAEYLLEMAMDMAWNIDAIPGDKAGIDKHLYNWLQREFGQESATDLVDVMTEYYRLAYIRKPEFMGNTRTEEKDPSYKIVSDLPWTEDEINQRLADYFRIEKKVTAMSSLIPENKKAAWYQLIEYPVRAAAEMNKKMLYGQLARHGKTEWTKSDAAYNKIIELTRKYNELENGKWNFMLDAQPRYQLAFSKLPHDTLKTPLLTKEKPLVLFNGADYTAFAGKKPVVNGLGYDRKAVCIEKQTTLSYQFAVKNAGKVRIELALVPNHPVNGNSIRFGISVNGGAEQIIDYHTEGRSEEWKQNVLRNQAIRNITVSISKPGKQSVRFRAIDEGVVLDQIKVFKLSFL